MSQEFVPDDNLSARPKFRLSNIRTGCGAVNGCRFAHGVRETILTLYRLGFAQVGDWSPVQRAANPKQVMSVLIRRRSRQA
jgi:hypothetical protein